MRGDKMKSNCCVKFSVSGRIFAHPQMHAYFSGGKLDEELEDLVGEICFCSSDDGALFVSLSVYRYGHNDLAEEEVASLSLDLEDVDALKSFLEFFIKNGETVANES